MMKFLKKLLWKWMGETWFTDYNNLNENEMQNWLTQSFLHPGFRDYFRIRDICLLKSISAETDDKERYVLDGQRRELKLLAARAKESVEKRERETKIKKS